jgi:hypothetical protein
MGAGQYAFVSSCGDIALKKAPALAIAGLPLKNASPQGPTEMKIKNDGLKVQVCALYLPEQGADGSVMPGGVTPAIPLRHGPAIVEPGSGLLSF